MRYMILIYSKEAEWDALSPEQLQTEMGAYMAYTDALKAAGKFVDGDQLHPVATAKAVRVRGGKAAVIDGPYVDTKEQLGGFYLIDAVDEADAMDWAEKCPGARHGGVELRPCVVF